MRLRSPLILLTALLVLAGSVLPATAAPPTKIGVAYDAAGLGDLGFNDLVAEGAARAEVDFGVKLFEKEMVKPSGAELDPEVVLAKLARKSELVVAMGFLYGEAALAVAERNPDVNVAIVDFDYESTPPNLLGALTAEHEGSFLVGAAAVLATEAPRQIGFLGGMDFPVIERFEAGFVAGVEHQDASAVVDVDYIGSFTDAAVMYGRAMEMYAAGADVIYHAAGYAGYGLFEAARDYSMGGRKVWAIGVDFDQYQVVPEDQKQFVLTSMLKNVDILTYDILESQVLGAFVGGTQVWDLSTGAVDYATSGGFVNAYVDELESIKALIIAGDIVVPTTR